MICTISLYFIVILKIYETIIAFLIFSMLFTLTIISLYKLIKWLMLCIFKVLCQTIKTFRMWAMLTFSFIFFSNKFFALLVNTINTFSTFWMNTFIFIVFLVFFEFLLKWWTIYTSLISTMITFIACFLFFFYFFIFSFEFCV